jgi:hypothetical protein
MEANSFQPQGGKVPHGALAVTVRPPGGPALGQHFAVNVQPAPGVLPGGAPTAPQMQAQISQPQTPHGAQPVQLVQQMGGSMAPQGPPVPQRSGFAPQNPALGQQASQQQNGDVDVVTVTVEGQGLDGRKYTADFDAVFPKGTKILGVRY